MKRTFIHMIAPHGRPTIPAIDNIDNPTDYNVLVHMNVGDKLWLSGQYKCLGWFKISQKEFLAYESDSLVTRFTLVATD